MIRNQIVAGLLSLTMIMQTTGCAHATHEQHQAVQEGRCDDALLEASKSDPHLLVTERSKQAAGTLLSYSMTGASYTAEVLWDFVGGTVMFVALCSPVIVTGVAAVASGSSTGGLQPFCFPGKLDALSAPKLGKNTYKSTRHLRCPNLQPLSESIREVASCYENKGDKENLVKARQNLNALQASSDFYECLPKEEQSEVQKASDRINAKLL